VLVRVVRIRAGLFLHSHSGRTPSLGEKGGALMQGPTNHVVDFLKANGLTVNRENYLAAAYLGNPPEELDPEQEAEMQNAIDEETRKRLDLLEDHIRFDLY
jgi:hypothetical protein